MSNSRRHVLVWSAWAAAVLTTAAMAFSARVPLPEIAQGLSRSRDEAGAEFDRRVRNAYPIGSSERVMMEALSKEGFSLTTQGGFPSARFERSGLFCRTLWIVYANADAEGRITVAEGNYGVSCIQPPRIKRYERP